MSETTNQIKKMLAKPKRPKPKPDETPPVRSLPVRICSYCQIQMRVDEREENAPGGLELYAFCPRCGKWYHLCRRAKSHDVKDAQPWDGKKLPYDATKAEINRKFASLPRFSSPAAVGDEGA